MVSTLESPTAGQEPPIEPQAVTRMAEMIMNEGYTFAHALDVSEDELKALYARGYDLQKRGRFEQAEQVFQYLCYLNHYDTSGWVALGFCRERLKQLDGALQAYIAAGLLDLENPIPPLRAAECLLQKGELAAAKRSAEMVLKLAGDAPQFEQRRQRANQLLKIIHKRERKRKPQP